MGILDRLRAQAPTATQRCQQAVYGPAREFVRCPNPATVHARVHPTHEVLVCETHHDIERLRGATYVQAYANGEKPDLVVVLGTWSS